MITLNPIVTLDRIVTVEEGIAIDLFKGDDKFIFSHCTMKEFIDTHSIDDIDNLETRLFGVMEFNREVKDYIKKKR